MRGRSHWAVAGGLAGALMTLSGCGPESPSTPSSTEAAAGSSAASVATEAPPASKADLPTSNWTYDTQKDEMRGTTSSFATVSSENDLNFGFPYKGGPARLTVRKRPEDGLSVAVQVEGQFLCNAYSGATVAVKFDSGPIQHFTCSEPSDASTGTLFIDGEQRFVSSLKAAKKIIVEAEFFQEGKRQMVFNVAGLQWPPKPPAS
jgi:hypothetical protein